MLFVLRQGIVESAHIQPGKGESNVTRSRQTRKAMKRMKIHKPASTPEQDQQGSSSCLPLVESLQGELENVARGQLEAEEVY